MQSAAGLVGASQLLRMPTMNAYAIVKNDKAAGFDAGRLESVYQRTMRNLHDQLKRDWATLEDPPHYNHKPYLHQDISMIESRPSFDYDDFAIIPTPR